MNPDTSYVVVSDAVGSQFVESKAALLNGSSGCYYSQNEVGTEIWKLLVADESMEEVIRRIREKYSLSEEQAKEDVLELIANLEAEKLITARK